MTDFTFIKNIIRKKSARTKKLLKSRFNRYKKSIPKDAVDIINSLGMWKKETKIPTENIISPFNGKDFYRNLFISFQNMRFEKYDIVITINTLRPGGISKLLYQYLEAISKSPSYNTKILVLSVDIGKANNRTFNNVDFLFVKELLGINFSQNIYNGLLKLIIKKYDIGVLWNFNCIYTYNFIDDNRNFINDSNIKLFGMIFSHWIDHKTGKEIGMAHDYLSRTTDIYTKITSDNQYFIEYFCSQYKLDIEKFITIYVPNSSNINFQPNNFNLKGEYLNVLWASNIETGKGIDFLLDIADAVKHLPIKIHFYGNTKNADAENKLLKLFARTLIRKNITYKGNFDCFSSIMKNENYQCFLFTSLSEGMPNVIVEAIYHQLSIVSPLVGGLNDILTEKNAYIVNKMEASLFAEQLEKVFNNRKYNHFSKELALHFVYNSKFTYNSFLNKIEKIKDYL